MTGEPAPAGNEAAGVENTVSGGIQFAPVVQGRDVQATFQLPAAAPTALAQLPAPVAGFTGREDELAVLAGLLDPDRAGGRVVVSAVAGLAGVGKTTLAVQAGHAAVREGWLPGGVLFVDLHGYDLAPVEPAQALDGLLRALGVPAEHIPPGAEQRAGLYRSVLAQMAGPVLVVADNASAEAQVRPLLPGAGPHKVLVTSRHTLAGLGARLVDVTTLDDQASVALLDAALRIARPGDNRITADPDAARRLAEACGGLPLALQITAALLTADQTLATADLADDLAAESQRLARLAYDDGSRTATSSVAAAFELSYARLDAAARRVFRLLPVNPGPDVSTAAAAILADMLVVDVRTVLTGLARAHLAESAPGTAGRWRMHDLLRLYAARLAEQQAEDDGGEAARDRLLGYYTETAEAADAHLRALPGTAAPCRFTGREDALAWLDAERASLVAAVTMAATSGRDQAAIRLPLALAEYFEWRRQFDDRLMTADIGLKAARRLSDRQSEGSALNNLGMALRGLRRFDEAIAAHQDAAAIFQKTGDRNAQGTALNNLGIALLGLRRFDEAIAAHQDAAAIFQENGDRNAQGRALNNLGIALQGLRRFDEAIAAHQDAAVIYRDTGDRFREGTAMGNLGIALQELRRFDEAIAAHQDATAIYRDTGDRHGEGRALTNLGLALKELRRFDEAITACQEAAAICRETDDRHGEGMVLTNLGIVLYELGRFDEAIPACREAAAIFQETGDRHREHTALISLCVALREAGWLDEAITACQDAAAIFQETDDRERRGHGTLEAARAARQGHPGGEAG